MLPHALSTTRSRRMALAASAATIAAITAAMLNPVSPAAASSPITDRDPVLTLEITSPHAAKAVVNGEMFTFEYEVRNDTGAPLDVGGNAQVDITFSYYFDGSRPVGSNCDFTRNWSSDVEYLSTWELRLPHTVEPGVVGRCTLTYEVQRLDIHFGGLWSMMSLKSDNTVANERSRTWLGLPIPTLASTPTLAAEPVVGRPLTVDPGFWGPMVGGYYFAPLEYQWFVDGDAAVGGTTQVYTPGYGDAGKEVWVEMYAPGPGIRQSSNVATVIEGGPVLLEDISNVRGERGYTEFYDEITWLARSGITTGYLSADGTRTYRPLAPVTRDAMAAFLYRYEGSPWVPMPATSPFVDVKPNHPFYKEIVWLSQEKISTGWSTPRGKEFRPHRPITRDAMAAFLHRLADPRDNNWSETSPFADYYPQHEFWREVNWMYYAGVITGWKNGSGRPYLHPHRPVTRDAMAAFLYRFDQAT